MTTVVVGDRSAPWTKQEQWVPFDVKGNQLHYPEYMRTWDTHEIVSPVWRLNEVFADTLMFEGCHRGRSAAYFSFMRESNKTRVCVFMTDFAETMVAVMTHGDVRGRFTFVKRGMNYGCKWVGE